MTIQDQILLLTKMLVSIPSVSGEFANLELALDLAKQELTGYNAKQFENNHTPSVLYYNTPTIPKKFKIILNAHLDVVPAKKELFHPVEKNGKLFGRGVYDMKTATAAMILVFKEVAKKVTYPLALQLVTDEEIGGFNGAKYQIEQAIKGDFVITGEPTDFHVVNQYKGMLNFTINFKGKNAHAAYPWRGENAIWKMNHFLNTLEKEFPIPKEKVWESTVNVAFVSTTNTADNIVPDNCSARFDLRFIPEESETIVERVKKIVPQDAEFIINFKESHHFTSEENELVQMLHKITKSLVGEHPTIRANQGSGDLRHFSDAGIEGVEFGPLGGGHHSDDEWVDIKSLETYYNILKDFLLSLS